MIAPPHLLLPEPRQRPRQLLLARRPRLPLPLLPPQGLRLLCLRILPLLLLPGSPPLQHRLPLLFPAACSADAHRSRTVHALVSRQRRAATSVPGRARSPQNAPTAAAAEPCSPARHAQGVHALARALAQAPPAGRRAPAASAGLPPACDAAGPARTWIRHVKQDRPWRQHEQAADSSTHGSCQ